MRAKLFKCIILITVTIMAAPAVAQVPPINIVAAENVYGMLALEIGGSNVNVQSIINNPDADPHLFATSPSTSKALSKAQIVIYNGNGYDSWMEQMLSSVDKKNIINIATLVKDNAANNPHLWYYPDTYPLLAKKLAAQIIELNPKSKDEVEHNLNRFLLENKQVIKKMNEIKSKYKNTPVIATEPVYNYATDAMGLQMNGLDLQWKVMNDTEPSPKSLEQYEELITKHKVKVLFYNKQVTTPLTMNIKKMALQNHIPIVGISETLPNKMGINQWLLDEVNQTLRALEQAK